jgi:hypothetical protein
MAAGAAQCVPFIVAVSPGPRREIVIALRASAFSFGSPAPAYLARFVAGEVAEARSDKTGEGAIGA